MVKKRGILKKLDENGQTIKLRGKIMYQNAIKKRDKAKKKQDSKKF